LCGTQGVDETRDAIWRALRTRARDNLHVMLAFSPTGATLRERLRKYPALAACCSAVDWFEPWPADALLSVGQRLLQDTKLDKVCAAAHVPACSRCGGCAILSCAVSPRPRLPSAALGL
jgi:dynein heavy chain